MRRLARSVAGLVLLPLSVSLPACGGSASTGTGTGAITGSSIPPGTYSCATGDQELVTTNGIKWDSVGAGKGTLALSGSGSSLSVSYTDTVIAGTSTVAFDISGNDSAIVEDGQTFIYSCGSSVETDSDEAVVSNVSAGSLSYDGSTLFVQLLGTSGSGDCSGQRSDLSLVCEAQ